MTPSPKLHRAELIAIVVTAAAGALLRLWSLGSLGLLHFDEGIYALTASGLATAASPVAIDPGVIPYAPPGYPFLVATAFAVLGTSDTAAFLVSIFAGIAAIFLVGLLTRRTFGPGTGWIGSLLAAVSGPHIAFSRMTLTDSTFLAAWLLALWAGIRLLEKPALGRAIALAVAVAAAQYVKYNGWLAGIILGLAALPACWPGPAQSPSRGRMVACLAGAGLLAGLLYWPWYDFVEGHGGYAGLMAHHRSYVQGPIAWPRNLLLQLDQVKALSGWSWGGRSGRIGFALLALVPVTAHALGGLRPSWRPPAMGCIVLGLMLEPAIAWWVAAVTFPGMLLDDRPGRRVLASGWVLLTLMTPLYHPYARLWLPLLALGWIGSAAAVLSLRDEPTQARWPRRIFLVVVTALALGQIATSTAAPLPGLLAPSDSVRSASREVVTRTEKLPQGVLVVARPSVLFYLSGQVVIGRMADTSSLLQPAPGSSPLVLLDTVQLAQEGDPADMLERIEDYWEIVGRWPTSLNPPTLLDVDPSGARAMPDPRDDDLILLRRRELGEPQ